MRTFDIYWAFSTLSMNNILRWDEITKEKAIEIIRLTKQKGEALSFKELQQLIDKWKKS